MESERVGWATSLVHWVSCTRLHVQPLPCYSHPHLLDAAALVIGIASYTLHKAIPACTLAKAGKHFIQATPEHCSACSLHSAEQCTTTSSVGRDGGLGMDML